MNKPREDFLTACNGWLRRLKENVRARENVIVCRSGFASIEATDNDQQIFRATLVSICDYLLGNNDKAFLLMPKEQRLFFQRELGIE